MRIAEKKLRFDAADMITLCVRADRVALILKVLKESNAAPVEALVIAEDLRQQVRAALGKQGE